MTTTHFLNTFICISLNLMYTCQCICCISLPFLAWVRKTYAPYYRLLVQPECAPKCINYESSYALGLDLMHLGALVLGQQPYALKCIGVRHFFSQFAIFKYKYSRSILKSGVFIIFSTTCMLTSISQTTFLHNHYFFNFCCPPSAYSCRGWISSLSLTGSLKIEICYISIFINFICRFQR